MGVGAFSAVHLASQKLRAWLVQPAVVWVSLAILTPAPCLGVFTQYQGVLRASQPRLLFVPGSIGPSPKWYLTRLPLPGLLGCCNSQHPLVWPTNACLALSGASGVRLDCIPVDFNLFSHIACWESGRKCSLLLCFSFWILKVKDAAFFFCVEVCSSLSLWAAFLPEIPLRLQGSTSLLVSSSSCYIPVSGFWTSERLACFCLPLCRLPGSL